METKFTQDNATFTFNVYEAEVLDSNQRSDTHVHGSGGGYIRQGSGYVSNDVSSHVEVTTNIWVNIEGHGEHHLQFDFDVAFRTGQKLKLIYLQIESPDYDMEKRLYVVVNLNTNRYHTLKSIDVTDLYPLKMRGCLNWLLFVFLICFCTALLSMKMVWREAELVFFIAIIAIYAIWRVLKPFFMMFYDPMKDPKSKQYKMKQRFEEELEKLL